MAKKNDWTSCKETPEGNVICEKFRKNKDGEKQVLAHVEKGNDGECNPVTRELTGKDEYFDEISEIADKRVSVRCKRQRANKPSDY